MTDMEIVCIDKQTFEELRERFCKLEEKVTRICRPVEDLGLKKWLDNQEVCEVLRISKKTLQVYRDKGILPYSRIKHKIFFKTEDVHKLLESNYHLLERKDPRVDVLFQGLDNMERLIEAMEDTPKSAFYGERFLTDEELSKILRVSRRTLQEYRTLGVVPYYLVQGKALYKESDILKILEDAYKRCREDMRWV